MPAAAAVERGKIALHHFAGFGRDVCFYDLFKLRLRFAGLVVLAVEPRQFQVDPHILGCGFMCGLHFFQRGGGFALRARQQAFGHQDQLRLVVGQVAVALEEFAHFAPLPAVDCVVNAQFQIVGGVRHEIGFAVDFDAAAVGEAVPRAGGFAL